MLIRRFTFTFATLLIFVFALFDQGMIFSVSPVSHETTSPESPTHVHSGTSQDGMVVVRVVPPLPEVSVNTKIANHSRTMRAFRATFGQAPATTALYVESSLPPARFMVSGSFRLSEKNKELVWVTDTSLLFYVTTDAGDELGILYDVGTHAIQKIPVGNPSPTLSIDPSLL